MEKYNYRFLGWFAAAAVLVFAVGVGLRGLDAVAPGGGGGAPGVNPQGGVAGSALVMPISDGDKVVADATAKYYFMVPSNWYVESGAGSGAGVVASGSDLAIYPDYDPRNGATPECKIEISVLAAKAGLGSGGLNAWVTQNLHADLTADVAEISRTPLMVGSNPTSSALTWHGGLNGVTTTLIYAELPGGGANGGENILEAALSTLSGAGDTSGDCDLAFQALVANLRFGSYEP